MPTGIRPPAPGAPYQLETLADFTGGLRRSEEIVNLSQNEMADIVNMDPDPAGGIRMRKGVKQALQSFISGGTFAFPYGRTLQHMGYYGDSQGGECVLIGRTGSGVDSQLWWPNKTSNELRDINVRASVGYRLGGWSFFLEEPPGSYTAGTSPTVYRIEDGDIYAGALTSMVELYENNYETPTTVGHPPARYACIQHNRAWIVDETLVNRVRFSHPGNALYWHGDDWIDVGPVSSDIMAIHPLGDIVLVLKQDGMWFIQGDQLSNMRLQQVDEIVAAQNCNPYTSRSSVLAYGRVWVWTKGEGLVSVGPDLQVTRHSDQLMLNGRMPNIESVSTGDGKIFCQDTDNNTWVFHVSMQCWSRYSLEIHSALDLTTTTNGNKTETIYIDRNVLNGSQHPIMVFDPTRVNDQIYSGSSTTFIAASVRTGWLAGGAPTERKKWGRPRVVIETLDSTDIDFYISVYKNYEYTDDATYVARSSHAVDASVDGDTAILRGPSAGRGEAVCYRIATQDNSKHADWSLHAISPRYRPERIRR